MCDKQKIFDNEKMFDKKTLDVHLYYLNRESQFVIKGAYVARA